MSELPANLGAKNVLREDLIDFPYFKTAKHTVGSDWGLFQGLLCQHIWLVIDAKCLGPQHISWL